MVWHIRFLSDHTPCHRVICAETSHYLISKVWYYEIAYHIKVKLPKIATFPSREENHMLSFVYLLAPHSTVYTGE